MEGKCLPKSDAQGSEREFMLTEWDSEHGPIDMHLKSIYRKDGWLCTAYETSALYAGTEGELYNLDEDPMQTENLWDCEIEKRTELTEQMKDVWPSARAEMLERKAPV